MTEATFSINGLTDDRLRSRILRYYGPEMLSKQGLTVKRGELAQFYLTEEKSLSGVNLFVPQSKELEKFTREKKTVINKSISAIGLAVIAVTPAIGMIVLKLFQFFDILRLVNVDVPANVSAFLDLFSENFLDFIPGLPKIDEKIRE